MLEFWKEFQSLDVQSHKKIVFQSKPSWFQDGSYSVAYSVLNHSLHDKSHLCGGIARVKLTSLPDHSGATLAIKFPPPETLAAGTEVPSQQAAPVNPQVPHLTPYTPWPYLMLNMGFRP